MDNSDDKITAPGGSEMALQDNDGPTQNRAAGAPAGRADGATTSRWAWAVLAIAVLAAAGAVVWSVTREDDAEPAIAQAEADGPVPIDQLRAAAEADPKDADAWQALGFAHFQQQEFAEAARAYRQAIEGDPDSAVLWSALGEARVMASQSDPMPAQAVEAFRKAVALDPADARARYFLGVKKDLDGDSRGAIADWVALLEDSPPGAPWVPNLRQTIEQVGKINKIDTAAMLASAEESRPGAELTAGDAIPGPSQEQIQRASGIPPGEQRDMAEGMVASLEGKLKADPSNIDGWVMLMRSRMALGQPDQAAAALKEALAANPGASVRLRSEAEVLGVPGQ